MTTMLMAMFSAVPVLGAQKEIAVELDGKTIEFDVNPEIIDGRTMVPLRKIFEEIGALVKWDGETQTISARKNKKTITLVVGSSELKIDKGKTDDDGNPIVETVALEVEPQIVSGRTLVPARAISESFGLDVEWDESANKVVITSEKDDEAWKENIGSVNLTDMTFEGKGIEINGNRIVISEGGDFSLTGTLEDGNITISAKERVKLRLDGVKITSSENPCIFVKETDKAFITVSEGTENFLVAQNSEDGAIYSKENLEIKGKGRLDIVSSAGHGIKASDNLNIENSVITIDATTDGIHINDTFKMSGGTVNINAVCDGIDAESIVNISGGEINIKTNGTPIQPEETTEAATEEPFRRGMWADEPDVEFEKSTKGINAEWMMAISGGKITVDAASHAIHCKDEIQIDGGEFVISSEYDKGISAHGNLTINGADTVIDIKKSTEGIESKNVMTINDGVIRIVSSDDGLNSTGGNSGAMMMPGGNFGGNRENGEAMGNPRGNGEGQPEGRNGEVPPSGRRSRMGRAPFEPNGDAQAPAEGAEGENRRGMPRFAIDENGEVTFSFENGEGGFVPPETNGENGENGRWRFPFGRSEDGLVPPETNGENGEFKLPFGNGEPPADMGGAMPGGFMGGMGANRKDCLIINGGDVEIYAEDDGIDANGNLIIKGGTVKATKSSGSFTGNFGVLDADGQTKISAKANLILVAGSGSERGLSLAGNRILVYCEKTHEANETIKISDADGNTIYEYTPLGSYKAVLISSNDLITGKKYVVEAGDERFEAELAEESTVLGTQTGGMGFGGMGFGGGFGNRGQQRTEEQAKTQQ